MWQKRGDTTVHEMEPYNAEPSRGALGRAFCTPIDTFYSRNHGSVPAIDPSSWRLRVDGLVDRPLELGLVHDRVFALLPHVQSLPRHPSHLALHARSGHSCCHWAPRSGGWVGASPPWRTRTAPG